MHLVPAEVLIEVELVLPQPVLAKARMIKVVSPQCSLSAWSK
jgi:hypothetical protein